MKTLKNMTHPLCASFQGNVINFKQSCLNNLGRNILCPMLMAEGKSSIDYFKYSLLQSREIKDD